MKFIKIMIHIITIRYILLIIIYMSGYICYYSGFSVAGGEVS